MAALRSKRTLAPALASKMAMLMAAMVRQRSPFGLYSLRPISSQASDRKSIFGQDWDLYGASATTGQLEAYGTWLDLPGIQADPASYVCGIACRVSDGIAGTGRIITLDAHYDTNTDCWAEKGQYNVHAKILP